MKKLKIAHIVNPITRLKPGILGTPSSVQAIAYLIGMEQVRRGHDVTFFAPSDSDVAPAYIAQDMLRSTTVGKTRYYSDKAHWEMHNRTFSEKVFAQQDQFDVIHNHFDWILHEAHRFKTPLVHTLHTMHLDHVDQKKTSFENVHFVSLSERQELNNPTFHFIARIPHGIPVNDYPFTKHPGRYFAWLGRFNEEKGPDRALDVALRAQVPIHFAGNITNSFDGNNFGQRMVEKIRDVGAPRARYIGKVGHHRKVQLLSGAQAVLMPVRWHEPFGLVAIESLACGTPVIAMRMGALPEIIEDGVSGLLVDTEDEMVRAIAKINQIDRRACRARVEKMYTVERMVDGYESAYLHI